MGVEIFFPSILTLTMGTLGIGGVMFTFIRFLKVDKAEESEV